MVDVLQQIEMPGIFQKSDSEQTIACDIERLHELRLLSLDVGSFLDAQYKSLTVVDNLLWLTLVI